ncbi:MAG: alpha-L-fucosidase [Bacteroidales bacterium]
MKRIGIAVLALILLLSGCKEAPPVDYLQETTEERDTRMEWWREARFGMFIHFGLYSVPAGEWGNETGHGEWIRSTAKIPLEEYNQFIHQFNPVRFDASEWVKMAKDAGMKYLVITSKHHEGFGLWNSKQTDFDVMSTPFRRDILKELAEACKKEGLVLCFYHSIMDWHHPDYLPRRDWETDRSAEGADFRTYVEYMKAQLKELLTRYGKIGILWFDGEWESTWSEELGTEIYQYVRSLQPSIIINNRVSPGRSGMEGVTEDGQFAGDYGTPEQQIPATGIPGYDWETCMTMNDHWGYNQQDKNFKSTRELLQMLSDIASKGGNYLLNVGPKADGTFPTESVERLRSIGKWMTVNGESIYGTVASPFKHLEWGRCTQRPMTRSTRLYLHVFDWPADGRLVISRFGSNPIRAYALADPSQEELAVERHRDTVVIRVGVTPFDKDISVVVLDIEGTPVVFDAPEIQSFTDIFIGTTKINLTKGEPVSELRYTLDGSDPVPTSLLYSNPFEINRTTTIRAACFLDGEAVSPVSIRTLTRVVAEPGRELAGVRPGLLHYLYEGVWDKIPDFNGLTPKIKGASTDFSLARNPADERFALDYHGFIRIPDDGVFTFRLISDDGSRLIINEKTFIDHDGLHGATAKEGSVALGKGLHPLRISYFEASGGNMLELLWSRDGNGFTPIPPEVLFHVK